MLKKRTGKGLLLILIAALILGFATQSWAELSNIIKIGSNVTVEEGQKIRNVIVIGGQITIDGFVENHVIAVGGSASTIVLTKTAVVGGNVISIGGIVVRGRGAEVQGDVTEINSDEISVAIANALSDDWEGWSWIMAIVSLSIFICVLLLTLLIVHFLPKPIHTISTAIQETPLRVILWGTIGLILIVPLAALLTFSVVGIVLIPLEITIVLCAVILGFIAVSQFIGEKMFLFFKRHDQTIARETIWGLIILWIIGWLPYVGWMLKVFAIVLGLGGVLITRFGFSHKR